MSHLLVPNKIWSTLRYSQGRMYLYALLETEAAYGNTLSSKQLMDGGIVFV